jgi:hypothetical protein
MGSDPAAVGTRAHIKTAIPRPARRGKFHSVRLRTDRDRIEAYAAINPADCAGARKS